MYILGIETSCDDTSCSILRNREILSNITISSLREHRKYGGIVPEIAHRNHLKVIGHVLKVALEKAGISLKDISLIGVTNYPGLKGALLVGVNFAKGLAFSLDIPLIGINHLHAHLFANFVGNKYRIKFPFIGVVISGGHTEIMVVNDFDDIETVIRTVDDACGEAFDKVGRAFNLGFPAGPMIDRLYQKKYKDAFIFKCGKIKGGLSFSGIKTALIYKKMELERRGCLSRSLKEKLLSSFQESILRTIVDSIFSVADKYKIRRIVCGGGVVANTRFREMILSRHDLDVKVAPKHLSVDNGAMVAGLAYYLFKYKKKSDAIHTLDIIPN